VNLVPQPHSHEGSEVVVGVAETPAETRLRDLAETIRREHELLVAAAGAMVLHAVAVGDAPRSKRRSSIQVRRAWPCGHRAGCASDAPRFRVEGRDA
jgi:hypothetical protein